MNLRDLEYFNAVAETGQFCAASERCFVSQPTLSGQIKKLEEELDQPLFERSTRRVRLTPFGEEALKIVKTILAGTEALLDLAEARKDPFQGVLRLGIFPTLGPWLFPALAEHIFPDFSEMETYLLEEQTEKLVTALKNGEIDAAFLAMPHEMEGFVTDPLFCEDFLAAVPEGHSWCRKEAVGVEDLQGQDMLLLSDGHCFRDQALDLCVRYGATERERYRATSLETLRQMVRMGTGITLIPRLAVPVHPEPGIRYLPVSNKSFHRKIALVYRETHPRREFFGHLKTRVGDLCGRLPIRMIESPGSET